MENKLEIITNKLLEGELSISEKAFNSPKIVKIPNIDLFEYITELLGQLFYKCGKTISGDELRVLRDAFLASLNDNYKWITLKELEVIFDKGRKKEFGDYFGLNINTFEMWIESWDKKDRPKEMLSRKFDAPIIEKKLTEQEEDKIMIEAIERAKDEFKKTGNLNAGAVGQYDWLDKNGKLLEAFNMSENDFKAFKTRIYKEVKESTKNILKGLKSNNIEEKRQIKQSLLDIEKNKSGEVISESKKEILKKYYSK